MRALQIANQFVVGERANSGHRRTIENDSSDPMGSGDQSS